MLVSVYFGNLRETLVQISHSLSIHSSGHRLTRCGHHSEPKDVILTIDSPAHS